MVVIEDESSDAKVGVRDLPENSREAGLLENKARERKKQSSPNTEKEQMAQLLGSLLGGANIPKFHNEDMDDDEDEEEQEHVAKHYEIPEETEQELRAKSRRNLIVLVLIVLSGLATMLKNGEDSPFAQVQSILFGGGKSSGRPRTAPHANHHKRETPEEEKKRKLQERMEKRRREAHEREMQNLNKYSHSSPKTGEKMKSKKKKGKKGANSKNEKTAKSGNASKPAPEKAEKEAKRLDAEEEMDRWRAQIEEELEL